MQTVLGKIYRKWYSIDIRYHDIYNILQRHIDDGYPISYLYSKSDIWDEIYILIEDVGTVIDTDNFYNIVGGPLYTNICQFCDGLSILYYMEEQEPVKNIDVYTWVLRTMNIISSSVIIGIKNLAHE